ncbi:MAG: hypothetical protein KC535_03145, partial [Nanoarchaeota archaeon]|nr:hypothetical protein [Nanoarchaeota archaeon]
MNERLEQMISFLIPAIERASDFHPHLVGEDSIEFKLENDSFARFFLHSENYKGLEIDINRQNREKNETMDFIDEDTGDIDEFPFYIGHIFYKD